MGSRNKKNSAKINKCERKWGRSESDNMMKDFLCYFSCSNKICICIMMMMTRAVMIGIDGIYA